MRRHACTSGARSTRRTRGRVGSRSSATLDGTLLCAATAKRPAADICAASAFIATVTRPSRPSKASMSAPAAADGAELLAAWARSSWMAAASSRCTWPPPATMPYCCRGC